MTDRITGYLLTTTIVVSLAYFGAHALAYLVG